MAANGRTGVHLDGVAWFDANMPSASHTCWAQSTYSLNGEMIERCACGGLRYDGYGPWIAQYEGVPDEDIPNEIASRSGEHGPGPHHPV